MDSIDETHRQGAQSTDEFTFFELFFKNLGLLQSIGKMVMDNSTNLYTNQWGFSPIQNIYTVHIQVHKIRIPAV